MPKAASGSSVATMVCGFCRTRPFETLSDVCRDLSEVATSMLLVREKRSGGLREKVICWVTGRSSGAVR